MNIIPAGFIVTNNEAIWGVGDTADAAWADFWRGMDNASVAIIGEHEDSGDQLGSWTRETDYTIRSASAGLLADVEARGGAIDWHYVGGVACTRAEMEG